MDSLRYWVTEMRVDGFRFDLAATLARQFHEVDRLSAFFDLVQQDPVVSRVKLIAEPWDVGDGGYQVGNFPPLWSEWNGIYRDTVRDFWRGENSTLPALASRLTGSSDLYQDDSRRPRASVNFVTCHDGFTLRDLVSYNDKHNDANGEDNRDGENHNRSWNCGTEGDTDNPEILALRARQQRNLLTTLLISQGVPMISHGDELGRTQHGNNNAYCQDSELSWTDWNLAPEQRELIDFTKRLIALRREHAVFRRRRFLRGDTGATGTSDSVWFRPDGGEMQEENWHREDAHAVALFLNGEGITEPDAHGGPVVDDSFLILLNSHYEPLDFVLPDRDYGDSWRVVIDTAAETDATDETEVKAGGTLAVPARGTVILTSPRRAASGRLRRALAAAARRPRSRPGAKGQGRRD
jgi:glycogen operon protein